MAYVYKHIRKDNNKTFYIGIGLDDNLKRASSKCDRNKHWKHIVDKVGYDIEYVKTNITWDEACGIEISLIKQFGRQDLKEGGLVNMTNGGDGVIGLIHTEEHKRKNSESNTGKPKSKEHVEKLRNRRVSDETKSKISLKNKGNVCSNETRKKISDKLKNKMVGDKNPFYGKNHSDITRNKISESMKGRKLSETTKKKISESNMGKTHVISEASKKLMSISAKQRNIKPPSRKGSCWVIKNNICKSINISDLDEHILNGWIRARK